MRRALAAVAVLAGLGLAAGVPDAAAEVIRQIRVEDNTKTTADTVALIANIEVGDAWTPDMPELIRQNLVSSGLFKDVEVFWSPVEGGVRVTLLVKDKHSWVIAPAFYNQPTNTGGGVGFGENNLFGRGQKLLLYAQLATGDSFFIGAWVIPSIGGTRFSAQVDTFLKSSRYIEYAPPRSYLSNPERVRQSRMHYFNGGLRLGVELVRGLRLDTRLRGAWVDFMDVRALTDDLSLITDDPGATPASIPAPGTAGWDVSHEVSLTLDRRANWYGIASGHRLNLSFEQSVERLGSDFNYWILNASAYKAWQILERHNFIVRGSATYGHELPFQQELTLGGTTMRGWFNDQFRGDMRVMGSAEYSVPVFTVKGFSMRALGFFDAGYTAFLTTGNEDRNYLPGARRDQQDALAGFKNSVGVGTRFYLRQIVLPLLGLDIGYGLEARDYQVYLAIGLTD